MGMILGFLTGSDIIICDTIAVTFTNVDGTTFSVLSFKLVELSTYQYYSELAEEFMALLNDRESWALILFSVLGHAIENEDTCALSIVTRK